MHWEIRNPRDCFTAAPASMWSGAEPAASPGVTILSPTNLYAIAGEPRPPRPSHNATTTRLRLLITCEITSELLCPVLSLPNQPHPNYFSSLPCTFLPLARPSLTETASAPIVPVT